MFQNSMIVEGLKAILSQAFPTPLVVPQGSEGVNYESLISAVSLDWDAKPINPYKPLNRKP